MYKIIWEKDGCISKGRTKFKTIKEAKSYADNRIINDFEYDGVKYIVVRA